ncbi:MAG: hypothetical protein IK125_05535 [Lachnospiraceae bacterium]|nr:hypothetical protein [Lachnospiraceae bacterium]
MTNGKVQLFEDRPIRTAWLEDEEEWYFSIVDVVGVLAEATTTEISKQKKPETFEENRVIAIEGGERLFPG